MADEDVRAASPERDSFEATAVLQVKSEVEVEDEAEIPVQGKKRDRGIEAEEFSQPPVQMQKRSCQSRGRDKVREKVERRNLVCEAANDDEDLEQLETKSRRGMRKRRIIADDPSDDMSF